jgi:hypothetical protein
MASTPSKRIRSLILSRRPTSANEGAVMIDVRRNRRPTPLFMLGWRHHRRPLLLSIRLLWDYLVIPSTPTAHKLERNVEHN